MRGGGNDIACPGWVSFAQQLTLRLPVQVWGIEHTSLIHSYLCMATTPIFIAAGTWILRRPISRTELGGTALGTFGTVMLTLGPAAKGSQVCSVSLCSSRLYLGLDALISVGTNQCLLSQDHPESTTPEHVRCSCEKSTH